MESENGGVRGHEERGVDFQAPGAALNWFVGGKFGEESVVFGKTLMSVSSHICLCYPGDESVKKQTEEEGERG